MREEFDLNGRWSVVFDHENKGLQLGWNSAEKLRSWHDVRGITVPGLLEEVEQDFEGVAWLHRRFDVPKDWSGQAARIRFEAVNYVAEVWINGEAAGAHEGGYTGFEISVGDLLRPGEPNDVVVRVITPIVTRDIRIDGIGRDEAPHWRGAIGGGVWQPVTLVSTGPLYVESTPYVEADPGDGRVTVHFVPTLEADRAVRYELRATVTHWNTSEIVVKARSDWTAKPGRNPTQLSVEIPSHKLWDVDSPHLYTVELSVFVGEAESDTVSVRFGFRHFDIDGKHFTLNGKRVLLKTVFSETYYPHSIAYPRDRDLLEQEFRLIKDGNINMVRPWRKPQPSVVYDMADELGVLYVGALPIECMGNWPRITPWTADRIATEIKEMINRDRNHPSIVIWEMFNEIMRDGLRRLKHRASLLAREIDGSRLIIDEAGGYAGGCSVYRPGSREPEIINDVHDYPGSPMDRGSYDALRALGKTEEQLRQNGLTLQRHTQSVVHPGLLTNISELGYGSVPDLEENMQRYERDGNPIMPDYRIHARLLRSYRREFERAGASSIFDSLKSFVDAMQEIHYTGNKLMAEACRINPDIAGIGIHSLVDGDWIVGAGLLDLFRNPKRSYFAIKETFAPRYLAIRPAASSVFAGDEVPVTFTTVNDLESVNGKLTVMMRDPTGREEVVWSGDATVGESVCDIAEVMLRLDGPAGRYAVIARLELPAGEVVNESSIFALTRFEGALEGLVVQVLSEDAGLADQLKNLGATLNDFESSSDLSIPLVMSARQPNIDSSRAVAAVSDWVRRGGTALVLDLPDPAALERVADDLGRTWRRLPAGSLLPFDLTFYNSKGLWTPCSHLVPRHEVFEDLPDRCIMGQEYQWVVPRWSIVGEEQGWVSAMIAYDWFPGLKHRQNYLGVTEAFSAADVLERAYGSGRYLLSTMRALQHVGTDPVARRLIVNQIRWASN
jgi:hypothetical protein